MHDAAAGLCWLIDDSDLILKLLCKRLSAIGASVRTFQDPRHAVRVWLTRAAKAPAIVLIDQDMPGLYGLETGAILRDAGLEALMLLHTATAEGDLRHEAKVAGFDGIVSKPVSADDLQVILRYRELVSRAAA